MRVKNIKTGLEGKATDIPFWNELIEKTADHQNRVYYCKMKQRPCESVMYQGCVYQEIFQISGDKE